MTGTAWANPVDGIVVGGSADITGSGNKLDIHQHTDRAVIDWRSFDIGIGEHTQFYQPNAGAIAVNRVNSVNPSHILGTLSANGNVVIINPNGVLFGKTAIVDVNGLVATTAGIRTDQVMSGKELQFDIAGNPDASVINEGHITAREAGLIGLVAPNVLNSGLIDARLGRVVMASGDIMTLDMRGDGLIQVAVSDAVKSQLVSNTGTVSADGGYITMTAAAGKNIVKSLIDVKGELKAPSILQKNGKIIIGSADDHAKIRISGKIDVSGKKVGEKGGTAKISAKEVTLEKGSLIDASGHNGGGTVLIGGDYKGANAGDGLQNADYLLMEEDASILNNALAFGDGGRTILWSDHTTHFLGSIDGRAGVSGGNGGFVETSGKVNLLVRGTVDLRGQNGHKGIWLLDPATITIYGTNGVGDGTNSFTKAQLEAYAASSVIQLQADDDIIFNMGGATITLSNGTDILFTAGRDILTQSNGIFKTTGAGSVTLTAGNNIYFANRMDFVSGSGNVILRANGNIDTSSSNSTITTGGGNIVLNSDRDANNRGRINLGMYTVLNSNGGNITLGGGLDPESGYAEAFGDSIGVALVYTDIHAGGGNIIINGRGSPADSAVGIYTDWSNIATNGNGTIKISGHSGGGNYSLRAIEMWHGNITAENGSISLTGQTSSSSSNVITVNLNNSTVRTTGVGDVFLTAINPGDSRSLSHYGTISSGRNIVYTGNEFTTNSTMNAAGTITLRPYDNNQEINIGTGNSGMLINSVSLTRLTAGDHTIIGSSDQNNAINIGDNTWSSSIRFITNNGNINLNGSQTMGTYRLVAETLGTGVIHLNDFGITSSATGIAVNFITNNGISLSGTNTLAASAGSLRFGHTLNGAGNLDASGTQIAFNGAWGGSQALGNVALSAEQSIMLPSIHADKILVRTGTSGDITLNSGTSLTADGIDDSLVLASGRDFFNLSNANALNASAGRWLVYSRNLANNTRGGLMPNAAALFNTTYTNDAPSAIAAGNRFLFSDAINAAPAITIKADDQSNVYGEALSPLTYTVSGNYLTGDDASSAYNGAPTLSAGSFTNANLYADGITASAGSLTSFLGYQFVFEHGDLNIDKANLTITANDAIKSHGQSFIFNGNEFSHNGLVAGDNVTHVDLNSDGADPAAAGNNAVYAIVVENAVGTGLENYTITYVGGLLTVTGNTVAPEPVSRVDLPATVQFAIAHPRMHVEPIHTSNPSISYIDSRFYPIGAASGISAMNGYLMIDPTLAKEYKL